MKQVEEGEEEETTEPEAKRVKEDGAMKGLTEYEMERNSRIERNLAVMRETIGNSSSNAPTKRRRPSSSPQKHNHEQQQRRAESNISPFFTGYKLRSRQQQQQQIVSTSTTSDEEIKEETQTQKEDQLSPEEKSVLVYNCRASETLRTEKSTEEEEAAAVAFPKRSKNKKATVELKERPNSNARLIGFDLLSDHEIRDSGLPTKIYSMCFSKNGKALCSGGHQGIVSIIPININTNNQEDDTVERRRISFKAHGGWVSSVNFVENLLLTSGNDRGIALWKLQSSENNNENGIPKALSVLKLDSGVFSTDENNGKVICAMKDGSIVLLHLTNETMKIDSVFSDLHNGVIKDTKFRDNNVFATTGNDKTMKIFDLRSQIKSKPITEIEDVHSLASNSVEWSTGYGFPNILTTGSFDGTIALIDLRMLKVIHRFSGHSLKNGSKIHRAIFVSNGESIVTSGEGSTRLSLYDSTLKTTSVSAAISRGDVGFEATCLESFDQNCSLLAAAHTNAISLLSPKWSL